MESTLQTETTNSTSTAPQFSSTVRDQVLSFPKLVWKLWSRFWFESQDLRGISLFRLVFGLSTLISYTLRHFSLEEFYSETSTVRAHQAFEIIPEFYRPLIGWYPETLQHAQWMHSGYLVCLFLLSIGFSSRLAAFVALIMHLAFLQRNFSVVYGADLVTTFWLFCLCFVESNRHFSVWQWWPKLRKWRESRAGAGFTRAKISQWSAELSSVGVRFLQIQLCIIYGYTGMEKLRGTSWWDGTAIWSVLGNSQIMPFDLSWAQSFPLVIAGLTHMTVVFEVYFPALVWNRKVLPWLLLLGCALHSSIAVVMGLFFFSISMMSVYFVFLPSAWLDRVQWLRPRESRHTQQT